MNSLTLAHRNKYHIQYAYVGPVILCFSGLTQGQALDGISISDLKEVEEQVGATQLENFIWGQVGEPGPRWQGICIPNFLHKSMYNVREDEFPGPVSDNQLLDPNQAMILTWADG